MISHREYNEFVPRAERKARAWRVKVRTVPRYWDGNLRQASFQVCWNGRWREIAHEVPFAKTDAERECSCKELDWVSLQAEMAKEQELS